MIPETGPYLWYHNIGRYNIIIANTESVHSISVDLCISSGGCGGGSGGDDNNNNDNQE